MKINHAIVLLLNLPSFCGSFTKEDENHLYFLAAWRPSAVSRLRGIGRLRRFTTGQMTDVGSQRSNNLKVELPGIIPRELLQGINAT